MKKHVVFLFYFLFTGLIFPAALHAQQLFPTMVNNQQKGSNEAQIQLNEVVVVSTRTFSDDTARYHYNQMKHYVKMILPYVDTAVNLFHQIAHTTEGMSKKNRRFYIRSQENEIKAHFDDRLASLNITQGRLLVKLINRQLDKTCYSIVKELRNPFSAAYYQSVARLNGIDLNEDYDPEGNRDLELIMRGLGYEKHRG